MHISPSKGYLYTFLFAFCSLGYEFIFIKTSVLIQGGQIDKYNLIVSLFTFSLGVGALAADKIKTGKEVIGLFQVELLLCLCGLFGPFAAIYFQSAILCHIFIIIVGFLSGFELPLLFKIFHKNIKEVLSFDYFGMFLAAIIIPLLLLKTIGLFPTLIILAIINLYVASKLTHIKIFRYFVSALCPVILLSALFYHQEINHYFSNIYISGVL
jgi:predicted membrane-bound spermidine synthase